MQINPDVNKQAQEVVFPRKLEKEVHPQIVFKNSTVVRSNFQKHLEVYLDTKLEK